MYLVETWLECWLVNPSTRRQAVTQLAVHAPRGKVRTTRPHQISSGHSGSAVAIGGTRAFPERKQFRRCSRLVYTHSPTRGPPLPTSNRRSKRLLKTSILDSSRPCSIYKQTPKAVTNTARESTFSSRHGMKHSCLNASQHPLWRTGHRIPALGGRCYPNIGGT